MAHTSTQRSRHCVVLHPQKVLFLGGIAFLVRKAWNRIWSEVIQDLGWCHLEQSHQASLPVIVDERQTFNFLRHQRPRTVAGTDRRSSLLQ